MITTLNQHKRDSFEAIFLRGGAVFIILGILSAVFELVTFTYYNENFKATDSRHVLSYVGTGIWCGALVFIAGVLTIVLGKKMTPRLLLLGITLAVFVTLVGAAQLTIEIISAHVLSHNPSSNSSSARSLHAMLGCIAILAIIAATLEIVFLFRIFFCVLSTAVPPAGFSNLSNYSQTEITRCAPDQNDAVEPNTKKVKVVYHKPHKMSELKVISSLSEDVAQFV